MKTYIFLTYEWHTYQPDSESAEPDIENAQVLWFSKGNSKAEWFQNFVKEAKRIKKTSFEEVFVYELKDMETECFYIRRYFAPRGIPITINKTKTSLP